MGFVSLQIGFSRAGTLADSNHTLNSPPLASISNAGCVHADAADFQGPFVASQPTPQEPAAGAVAAGAVVLWLCYNFPYWQTAIWFT